MIYLALALLGFGVADLVRWSPEKVEKQRAVLAAAAGTASVVVIDALAGSDALQVVLVGMVALVVLMFWSAYDLIGSERFKPGYPISLVVGTIVILIALSGSADPIGGELATWYSNLDFGFVHDVAIDQFVLGVGAVLFLLATGNRIVRFTLAATEASLIEGEGTMRGGRVLGPMERLIVAAAVISGGAAGAGFVIAAKGLLRFREIRGADQSNGPKQPKVDEITEYFLVGTFTSVIIAAIVSVLVLAAA